MKGLVIRTKEETVYYSGKSDEEFKANKEKAIEEAKAKYKDKKKYIEIEVEDNKTTIYGGETTFGSSIIKAKYEGYESYDSNGHSTVRKVAAKILTFIGVLCFIVQFISFFLTVGSVASKQQVVGYVDSLHVYDVVKSTSVTNLAAPVVMSIANISLLIITFIRSRLDEDIEDSKGFFALVVLTIIASIGSIYVAVGMAFSS